MKNKVKFIALGLCCCLLLGIFVVFSSPQKQPVYATVDIKINNSALSSVEWTEITEKDYIKEMARTYHIPFSKAKQINLENNMKQVPEAFNKNADDSYAPKILYRTIYVKQDAVLNTKVIGTINVKMVSKGTYDHAHADKKFLEVLSASTKVEGNYAPIWVEDWINTNIEEGNEKENSLWVSISGTLKYDIDAKVAATLNLEKIFEIEGEGSTRLQFSRAVGFTRELRSNDY